MVYRNIDDATRCWIKGRRFSLAGLLGDAAAAEAFDGGSLAIFRLVRSRDPRCAAQPSAGLRPLLRWAASLPAGRGQLALPRMARCPVGTCGHMRAHAACRKACCLLPLARF